MIIHNVKYIFVSPTDLTSILICLVCLANQYLWSWNLPGIGLRVVKSLICRIFLWKFIHEVKSVITFESSDNYWGIQQNSTCNAESAQKRKMHVNLARLHNFMQQFLSYNSFTEWLTEKKNRQHFHHPTAYHLSRESKGRWYTTTIRIDYVVRL